MEDNNNIEETHKEEILNNDIIIDKQTSKPETTTFQPIPLQTDWLKKKMTISINDDTISDIRKVCPESVKNVTQFVKWVIASINEVSERNNETTSLDEQELVRLRNENMELKKEIKELEDDKHQLILKQSNDFKVNPIVTTTVTSPQPQKKSNDFMNLLGF